MEWLVSYDKKGKRTWTLSSRGIPALVEVREERSVYTIYALDFETDTLHRFEPSFSDIGLAMVKAEEIAKMAKDSKS